MLENARNYIVLITIGTILSAFSIAAIISFTEPDTAGLGIFVFLYFSIFLCCAGVFTIAGLAMRQRLFKTLYVKNLQISLRQGILVSMLVTVSLGLNAHSLFYWWVALTLILLVLVIEVFFNLN